MTKFVAFLNKIFKVKGPLYYVEAVRVWNHTSYDTQLKCLTAANPVFIIKKRNVFGPDEKISVFWYSSSIEDALDEVRKLNGCDYITNESAYANYDVYHHGDENQDSGVYVKEK